MKKKSPLFIEFVGLPGAGKSTIASELSEHLKRAGYDVSPSLEAQYAQSTLETHTGFSSLDRLVGIFHGIGTETAASVNSYLLAASVSPLNIVNILRGFNLVAWYKLNTQLKHKSRDIVILSEGIAHVVGLISICGSLPPQKYFNRLLSSYPSNRVLIYVDTALHLCLDRTENRNTNSRFDTWGEKKKKEKMQIYAQNISNIIDWFELEKSVNTIRIDGTNSLIKNIHEITNNIERQLD